jgi:hypothetical protein
MAAVVLVLLLACAGRWLYAWSMGHYCVRVAGPWLPIDCSPMRVWFFAF